MKGRRQSVMTSTSLGAVGLVQGVHGDFFLPPDDLILNQIRAFGAHTRPEIALLRRLVQPGDTVVDVGAHVGTFAIPLAYSVGWGGRVLAFEPNPTSVELLRLNVALNGMQSVISVSSLALAATEADYHLVESHLANSGASHLVAEPPSDHSTTVAVAATTLDRVLAAWGEPRPTVSLIKIDVEGMEEAVIGGASATIETDRPVVYFEVAAEQARRAGLGDLAHIDLLGDLGYRLARNTGPRNAAVDAFELELVDERSVQELRQGSEIADLVAIPDERDLETLR